MKKILILILVLIIPVFLFVGCDQAGTVKHNIQKDADKFDVYRKITFINLNSDKILYSAEGYFSIQTTYENSYQGQQEIGLVFKIAPDKYKMDYFSIDQNVSYVIEQSENTTTDPYHWEINWYVAIPDIERG